MGRRPTPAADRSEPIAPPPAIPEPPPIVAADEDAAAEWSRVTELLLREGAVAELDRAALSLYCTAYARWLLASTELHKSGGPLVLNDRGEPAQNPWLSIVNQAARALAQAAAPLGLSPAARGKITRPGAASPTVAALDTFLDA
ncbi:MAG TPA: phage terminase small subunit P27 family [Pirellulales bacterium]|nr:phage terminase small subunit P27 family [Pirellulales bacterium]